ncbi:MAG: methionyl-tRNA formyltransferase [Magnetospirillum sp.]|nr:methionyl-tRNA formyltransferase [Magnetospirillum sp.]
MRIVVCTKRDLAGSLILNDLMPRLAGHSVLVLLSDKTRPVETAVPELAEIKYLERDLPIGTLFPLVDGLGGGGTLDTFDGCAARFGVPLKVVEDVNAPATAALLRDFAPDLMVSARFSHIFKAPVFEIPRLGTYNIHPGALPAYAGLFAPMRGLMDGAERIGCTLHRVDSGIDTGPVVGIGWLAVDRRHSLLWHVVNSYRPGLDLFVEMMARLEAGQPAIATAQDRSLRRYAGLPGSAAFAAFRAQGFRIWDGDEYAALLAGFLPPGLGRELAVAPPEAGKEWGAPCCCARA